MTINWIQSDSSTLAPLLAITNMVVATASAFANLARVRSRATTARSGFTSPVSQCQATHSHALLTRTGSVTAAKVGTIQAFCTMRTT